MHGRSQERRIVKRGARIIRNNGIIDAAQRRQLRSARKVKKAEDSIASQGLRSSAAKDKSEEDEGSQFHEIAAN